MWTTAFWVSAAERAVKTAAQVTITFVGADIANAFAVDYQRVAGIALGAALVSLLTSIASSQAGPAKGTPSLVGEGS
jgi:ABC-type enterochelin transport system permease subunit